MEKPNFKQMCLMYIQQLTNFPYIEKDFDALTDYELLCKIVAYLNKIITNENQQNETITALYNAFVELKDYVDNYFDNLDLQEEVNDKLDEMAASGELNTLINSYDILKVIAGKFNPDEISSNYTILKNQDKVIMIDSSYTDNWSRVEAMLNAYKITHLDCFILTHYDNDHAQNFVNGNLMINGYINSETKLYLPSESNAVSQAKIIAIKNLCEEYGLTYNTPTEGEVYAFANTKVTFTNVDVAQVNAYYSPSTEPNLYSTICLIEHKNDKLLFTADADNESFKLMELNNIVAGTVDFVTIPHHGFNVTTDSNFVRKISPYIALQEAGSRQFASSHFTASPFVTQLINQGCKLVPTFIQSDYVEIDSTGFGVNINKGIIFNTSNYLMESKDIYVDIMASNNNPQLGTKEYPFRELNQALSTIKNYDYNIIRIHLADGTYNTNIGDLPPERMRSSNIMQNFPKNIVISGNSEDNTAVIIKGIIGRNIGNLVVQDLTIYNQYRIGVELYNSNCYINNCIITNPDNATTYDAFYMNASNLILNNVSVLNAANVLNGFNSSFRCYGLTVDNFAHLYPSTVRCSYIIDSITFIDDSLEYEKKYLYKEYKGLRQIYTNSNTSSTVTQSDAEITLPFNITSGIKNLKILLATSSGHQVTVECRYPNSNKDVPFNITLGSDVFFYIISGMLKFSTNKIQILNQQQLKIRKATGEMEFTTWGEYYIFRIVSVWIDDNY